MPLREKPPLERENGNVLIRQNRQEFIDEKQRLKTKYEAEIAIHNQEIVNNADAIQTLEGLISEIDNELNIAQQ